MIKGILYQMCKNKQQQRLSLQQTHSRVQQLDTSQTHQKTKTSFYLWTSTQGHAKFISSKG